MEDKEFNKCNRELKKYLKTKYGKRVNQDVIWIFQNIFREGYKLGIKSKN